MRIRVMLVATSLMVAFSLTGCKKSDDPVDNLSKKDAINMVKAQNDALIEQGVRVEELETLLKGIQEQDAPTAAISAMSDGTGRLTFNSIDGKIVFPKPFEYPGSSQAPNTSSVNISTKLSVAPTNNWVLVLDGTKLELEHSSGITGVIKSSYIKDIYSRDDMQEEVMSPFFAEFPPDRISYSKLFLDDNWWGLEAQTPTRIDSEDSFLRCGMVGLGDQSFTYMFVYKGEQDATKDESIVSLLKTVKMLGMPLRIE